MELDDSNFAKAALKEQISLNLTWYSNIKNIVTKFDNVGPSQFEVNTSSNLNALLMSTLCSSSNIRTNLQAVFIRSWKTCISSYSKLEFYHSIKDEFHWEPYLDTVSTFKVRRSTARVRCSAHKLNIEVGRYNHTDRTDRICDFCVNTNQEANVESEDHLLNFCPLGNTTRNVYQTATQDVLICNGNPTSIGNFQMAKTYPSNIANNGNQMLVRSKIIKLACNAIHHLYTGTLKYKNEVTLPADDNPTNADHGT